MPSWHAGKRFSGSARVERAQARALNMEQVGFGPPKQMRSRAVGRVRGVPRMHTCDVRAVSACGVMDVMHGRPPAPYPCGSHRRHAAGCRVIEADRSGNECTNSAEDHPFSAIAIRKRKQASAGARKLSFEAGRIHATTMLARIQAGWSEAKPNPSTHACT